LGADHVSGDELGGGARGGEGGVRHRRVGLHRVLDHQAAPSSRLHRPRHRAGHRPVVVACLPPPIPYFDGFGGMELFDVWSEVS
jgi:hypothetical protein